VLHCDAPPGIHIPRLRKIIFFFASWFVLCVLDSLLIVVVDVWFECFTVSVFRHCVLRDISKYKVNYNYIYNYLEHSVCKYNHNISKSTKRRRFFEEVETFDFLIDNQLELGMKLIICSITSKTFPSLLKLLKGHRRTVVLNIWIMIVFELSIT